MPALIVLDGPAAGQRLEIDAEVTLGRETHEPLQHDGEVSRRHAAVRPAGESLEIEDLGSSNGTFVNDQRITETTPIRPGDTLRLGQTTMEVEATPATAATTIREVPEAGPPSEPPQPDATAPIGADPGPGPVPADPPPLGPPPTGPPPVGPPPLGPPPSAPPGTATGRRPGVVTAAGVVLILAGVLALGFAIWRAFAWFGLLDDVRTVEEILGFSTGATTTIMVLLGFLLVAAIGAVELLIGGIRFLGLSRAGLLFGVFGGVATVVGWLGFVVWGLTQDLVVETADWIAAIASVTGAGVGLGLLLGGRRYVAPPRSTPWAA